MISSIGLLIILLFPFCHIAEAVTHPFTGLPIDANGWTDYSTMTTSGYGAARVIFVSSSSGNDGAGQAYGISALTFDSNGMFQAIGTVNAYQTLAAGYAMMRNGYPDIMLLKRGDTWTNELLVLTKSGPSGTARTIISSYGAGNRPTLSYSTGQIVTAGDVDNLIISGIHTKSTVADPDAGLKAFDIIGEQALDHLYEDLEIEYAGNTINTYPKGLLNERIAFRRCIFKDRPLNDRVMLYAYSINSLLLEENVFWLSDELLGRRIIYTDLGETTQNELVLRGNIFFRGDYGVHLRGGGTVDNNLFLQMDNLLVGGWGGNGGTIHAATVSSNVFAGSREGGINQAITIINNSGSSYRNNIFTGAGDMLGTTNNWAMRVMGAPEGVYICNNTEIKDNIVYKFSSGATNGSGLYVDSDMTDLTGMSVHDNDFQFSAGSEYVINQAVTMDGNAYANNRYYSIAPTWFRYSSNSANFAAWEGYTGDTGSTAVQVTSYPSPDRTVAGYNQSLGGTATTEAFMAETLEQARHNWRHTYTVDAVNDYIRAGFGMGQRRLFRNVRIGEVEP